MNEPLEMWSYWRSKYGVVAALKEYFPETLASDPILTLALSQITLAHLAIEARIAQLVSEGSNE